MIKAEDARKLALENAKTRVKENVDKVEAEIANCIASGLFVTNVVIDSDCSKFVIDELRKHKYKVEIKSVGSKTNIQIDFS